MKMREVIWRATLHLYPNRPHSIKHTDNCPREIC